MRRTIAVTVVVGLLMMGLTAAIASADKGGVPHEGSNGKGRPAQGAPPAANEQQDAQAPARRTPPPRKKERADKHTHHKAKHQRQQAPAAAPAPATAPSRQHGQPKVTICHHTGSQSNPWVQITVAEPAVKAHRRHGDLVPAPAGGCPRPAAPAPAHEAPAKSETHGQSKVTICHHTGSQSNPWVQITVAEPALKAHRKHGDVIPAPAAGCGNAEEQPQPDEPVGSPGGDAQTPTPSSGPTFAAGSAAQPMPDGGLGPVWIVHRSVPRGAVLAETASSSPGKARGRVLAATASAPAALAAEPASGSGLPFTGWPAWLVVMVGAAALLAGFALRRAHATHR